MVQARSAARKARAAQAARRAARPPLMQLPPELLLEIYLQCLEPNMALASGYLGVVLSREVVFRATVFQAFWNPSTVVFVSDAKSLLKLTRYYKLARYHNLQELKGEEQRTMQEIVLTQRWCTFDRLWTCFSTLLSTVWQDLLQESNWSFSPEQQLALNNFVNNPPRQSATFEAEMLDGISIRLEHQWSLARYVCLTYYGPDVQLVGGRAPHVVFHPAEVTTLPDSVLRSDNWTEARIQKLQMLCIASIFSNVNCSPDGFYVGMRNAVLQRNSTALLVLAWAFHLNFHWTNERSYGTRVGLPEDLFRLVIPDSSEDNESADAAAISMFKILVRTQAESMTQFDEHIIAWARKLLHSPRDRLFGKWLIDFSVRRNVYTLDTSSSISSRSKYYFTGGSISADRKGEELMEAFCRIEGCEPKSFDEEVGDARETPTYPVAHPDLRPRRAGIGRSY